MDIEVFCNNRVIPLRDESKKKIISEVTSKIISGISFIYTTDDINKIDFHLKGVDETNGFFCILELNFIESDDVIALFDEKLQPLSVDKIGLSYMKSYKTGLSFNGLGARESRCTQIHLWYTFDELDKIKWNKSKNIN